MKNFELIFDSLNSEKYVKPITVLVMQPDEISAETGIMLFTHGWGGNRFQHADKMEWTADRFNVVCLSVEYRMSGYDFNPVTGRGAYRPYDASFLQTLDVLNALRVVMEKYPSINQKRIFHYGGSQGGHICLLSSIFAPNTFAFVYASCPIVRLAPDIMEWAGREFAPHELAARNVLKHSHLIKCPIFLEYGTVDEIVPCIGHSELLIKKLKNHNHPIRVEIYDGGGHNLEPTITKLDAFQKMAPAAFETSVSSATDDFIVASTIRIPCDNKTLEIDWSRRPDDINLAIWK